MSLLNRLIYSFLIVLSTLNFNPSISYASDEEIDHIVDADKQSIAAINDNFRQTSRRIRAIENGISLTSGVTGILPVANGGTGQDASAWTSGDVIYLSGTGIFNHISVTSLLAGFSQAQLFTSSGTFVAPAGITKVFLTGSAPGGGGPGGIGGGGTGNVAGGPSAGEYVTRLPFTVIPGNSYTVTIGSPGVGGTGGTSTDGTDGTDGGNVVFDTITLIGGKKGTKSAPGINTPRSFNAHATNGTPGTGIQAGGNGGNAGVFNVNGPGGGSNPFGIGGTGGIANAGVPYGFGAGGGGGLSWNPNPGGNGSNGAPGFWLVEW